MFLHRCYFSHAALSQLMWSTFIYTHSLSHPHSSTHTHNFDIEAIMYSHLIYINTRLSMSPQILDFSRVRIHMGTLALHMRARWNTLMGMRIVVYWLSIVKCWFAHDPHPHLQLSIPLHLRINHIRWTLFPFLFTEAKFAWQTSNTIF